MAVTIPTDQAARALNDAEAAAGRSQAARGYQKASLHLILWGVIWTVASVLSHVSLAAGQAAWNVGVPLGVVISIGMSLRQRPAGRGGGWLRSLLVGAAVGGFGASVGAIVPSITFTQYSALACLAVGAIYVAMGASAGGGLRLSVVGAAVIGATLVGWFYAREFFFLWMAVAGGGGLILGGLWFRKA